MAAPTRTRSSRRGDDRVPEGPLAGTETGRRGREPRRRLNPTGQAIVVAFGALLLAAFLNAPGLRKTAQSMNPSWKRDVGLALTKPLETISHDTGLDLPRRGLKALLGRSSDDDIATAIVLPPPPPPPPGPNPNPPVAPPANPQNPPPPPPVAPPPPPKKPAFSAAHPLRVYIGGDSLVIVPGESMLRAMGSKVYKAIDSVDG